MFNSEMQTLNTSCKKQECKDLDVKVEPNNTVGINQTYICKFGNETAK